MAAFLAAAVVLGSTLAVGSNSGLVPARATVEKGIETPLTPTGQGGVDDLRECLAQDSAVLNVYYLIDNSGSMADTDRDVVRADLLANSLRELATLRDDITVNYAAGFFSTRFTYALPWTPVAANAVDEHAAQFAELIRLTPPQGWTNWLTAIEHAQVELASQSATAPGCQALIWLTDGGIDLGTEWRTNAAVNALCGDQNSVGALAELRQAGVSVFGVLYVDDDKFGENAKIMQPLVEGEAEGTRCGGAASTESARGVYLRAKNVDDLAVVFMRLGVVVGGGVESPFGQDGTFHVDRGIARFTIVTTVSGWSLESPDGRVYTAADVGPFEVTPAGSAARITSPLLHPDDAGTWIWSPASGGDTLYFSSGLRMQLDEPRTFLAGADNELSGRILRDGAPQIALDAYQFAPIELTLVTVDGEQRVPVDDVEFSLETGEFTFHLRDMNASGQVELQARLSDIVTVPSRTPVADIAARQHVTVTLPRNYPTITPMPVTLDELRGADGRARGSFTVRAPEDGSAGSVCFPNGLTPIVTQDVSDRGDSWAWADDASFDECVELAPGGTVDVELTAGNSVAANSVVEAHLTVRYISETGEWIEGSVPVTFTTTRPVNALAFGALAIVLLAAGLVVPLAMLWLFGWWFARVNRGKNLYRASVPVRIAPGGAVTAADDSPLASQPWGVEQFRFHRVEHDSRRFADPDLGEIRARMPLNPFGNPWYQLEPKNGTRLIGAQGALPTRLEPLRAAGRLMGIPGDLGRLWALVIPERSLASDPAEPLDARLVAYLRAPSADSVAFISRITSIATDPAILRQLRAIRTSGAVTDGSGQPGRNVEKAADNRRLEDEPPRRSRTATNGDEPPRRGRSATLDSEPPRRNQASTNLTEPPQRDRRPGGLDDPPRRDRRIDEPPRRNR